MNYWLLKSEPGCYSIEDFKRDKTTQWTGIRNYQARNFMQAMKVGDKVLFYHSGTFGKGKDKRGPEVAGVGKVVGEATPDLTALDRKDDHYDPKATKTNPIWYGPTILYENTLREPVTLAEIKRNPAFEGIMVAERGSRLSVQPVSGQHFAHMVKQGQAG